MSYESADLPTVTTILYKGFHHSKFPKIALPNQEELCEAIDNFILHNQFKNLGYGLNPREEIRCRHTLRSSGLKIMIAKTNHDGSVIIYYYSSDHGNYIVSFDKGTSSFIGYIKTFSDDTYDRMVLECGDSMMPDTEEDDYPTPIPRLPKFPSLDESIFTSSAPAAASASAASASAASVSAASASAASASAASAADPDGSMETAQASQYEWGDV